VNVQVEFWCCQTFLLFTLNIGFLLTHQLFIFYWQGCALYGKLWQESYSWISLTLPSKLTFHIRFIQKHPVLQCKLIRVQQKRQSCTIHKKRYSKYSSTSSHHSNWHSDHPQRKDCAMSQPPYIIPVQSCIKTVIDLKGGEPAGQSKKPTGNQHGAVCLK
jgi:hypothetical protein